MKFEKSRFFRHKISVYFDLRRAFYLTFYQAPFLNVNSFCWFPDIKNSKFFVVTMIRGCAGCWAKRGLDTYFFTLKNILSLTIEVLKEPKQLKNGTLSVVSGNLWQTFEKFRRFRLRVSQYRWESKLEKFQSYQNFGKPSIRKCCSFFRVKCWKLLWNRHFW